MSSASGGIDCLTNGSDMLGKAGQEKRVKDATGPGHDHLPGLPLGKCGLIDPGMNQRVKGIRQPYYLYPGCDAFSGQFVRVACTVPPLMVVAADVADGGERLALPQLRHPLQQVTALGGMGLHHLKLLFGQGAGLIENFLRDGPLAHVMEQGQGGVEPDFRHSQRWNDSGGGKGTQKLFRQVIKLYAVGSVLHEQLFPAQDSEGRFYVQCLSPHRLNGCESGMKITELDDRDASLLGQLLNIWEDSVRATHLFLSDPEIEHIKGYVPDALKAVPHLIIGEKDSVGPVAFMGINGQSLEMLFISPEVRGQGLGKKLIRYGVENYNINKVTVNEQNLQASGFYEHMGFVVYKRSETDGQGNPYPLLYMELH